MTCPVWAKEVIPISPLMPVAFVVVEYSVLPNGTLGEHFWIGIDPTGGDVGI